MCLNCTGALRMSSVAASLWNARSSTMDILKEEWLWRLEIGGNEKASQSTKNQKKCFSFFSFLFVFGLSRRSRVVFLINAFFFGSLVFKHNNQYQLFHTKYTSAESLMNVWLLDCAVAQRKGLSEEPPKPKLPLHLEKPTGYAATFHLPQSQ